MNPIFRLAQKMYRTLIPFEWRIAFRDWRRVGLKGRSAADYADELRQLLKNTSKGVVIFPPGFGWTTGLFQRPHHLARELARLGFVVLFMDYIERGQTGGFERVESRLYVAALPFGVQRRVFCLIERPIVLTPTYQYPHLSVFRDPILIYDVLDHLEVFLGLHPMDSLKKWHAELLQRADIVLCTSDILLQETQAVRPDAILCPNGVDADHFVYSGDPPDALKPILAQNKPIIGYYGTLARWIDYELIRASAKALPDCHFVLIGPDSDGSFAASSLTDVKNISWIDRVPYADLPAYLAFFDVATIPFVVNDLTVAVSPVKLFEYMAGGRPIVSTALPECRKYAVVNVADSADEYIQMLRSALTLHDAPDHRQALRATAQQNTWTVRSAQIADALDQARTKNVQRFNP